MGMEVRGNLYELLAACLPPDFIIKELLKKLVASQRNDVLKQKAVAAAAHFESTMRQGSKDIFHLEAFVLRFMADLKASEVRACSRRGLEVVRDGSLLSKQGNGTASLVEAHLLGRRKRNAQPCCARGVRSSRADWAETRSAPDDYPEGCQG